MTDPSSKESIFFAALELPTAEGRAALLDGACRGNEPLRRQVERLLAAHARVGGFLERPVQEVDATPLGSSGRPASDAASDTAGPRAVWPDDNVPLDFLVPSHRPDALGRLGHYEVLQVLGTGGMGVVLRAFDEKLHRVVAIKVLAPALAVVTPARRRFVREARSAAAVIHDNVVAVHAVEEDGPVPYLIMQYVSGPTLQQKIDQTGPLPIVEILRLGMQTAAGLAAAAAQGLVHRDIKPANILLENGVERVKITDFGLARAVDEPSATNPGVIAGTPEYMSPEQAAGDPVDHRSDLFSLGSVLYAMCTGYAPFRADSMMGVLKRVCESTPRPVRELNPDIPDWLEALIAALHAKDPARRPKTATEIAEQLGRRLAELQQPNRRATPQCPPPPARGPVSRWKAVAGAILLLAGGLSAAEAAGVIHVHDAVIRLLWPDGTLVVEVDDPAVSVAVEGTDVIITGARLKEIQLRPGEYQVTASKDGRVVQQELVMVSRNGRHVVTIGKEAGPPGTAEDWERSVAGVPADQLVQAVTQRLKDQNPGFDGELKTTIQTGEVTELYLVTDDLTDISPVRAFRKMTRLTCPGSGFGKGKLKDLTPLRGLKLNHLECNFNPVADLEPLRGMPLNNLNCGNTRVRDLSPLQGMKLEVLMLQEALADDLTPLRDMPLVWLDLYGMSKVSDIGQLKGMPLIYVNLTRTAVSDLGALAELQKVQTVILDETPVTDLTPLRTLPLRDLSIQGIRANDLTPIRGMPLKSIRIDPRPDRAELLQSLVTLESINDKRAAEFWKIEDMK